jgi:ketosteroid isomerase-like protein
MCRGTTACPWEGRIRLVSHLDATRRAGPGASNSVLQPLRTWDSDSAVPIALLRSPTGQSKGHDVMIDAERVVREWHDAYSRRDVEKALSYMADDMVRRGELADGWISIDKPTWGDAMVGFFAAFPDWGWELTRLVASGDQVACEFLEHGTFTVPYEVLPGLVIQPTGDSYEDRDGVFFRVSDEGLISEIHAYVTKDLNRKFGFETVIAEFLANQ